MLFALVALPAAAEVGESETIVVPPKTATSQPRTSTTMAFEPGRTYRARVSGTIEARNPNTGETLVFSAFHCVSGCADHVFNQRFMTYNPTTGESVLFPNLVTPGYQYPFPASAPHAYEFTLQNFPKRMRLAFEAIPYGRNPDAYGRSYSGDGFKFEFREETRLLAFRFRQEGEPVKPPRRMISSQLQAKGTVLLPDAPYEEAEPGEPRGSTAYVAINEGSDHLVAFRLVGAGFRAGDDGRYLRLMLKVRKSTDPDCDNGSRAVLELRDSPDKRKDVAALGSRACGYKLRWTRESSDEFQLSVGEPK